MFVLAGAHPVLGLPAAVGSVVCGPQLAMKATPYRKDFYAKLGHDQEALHMDMVSYFHALKNIVAVLVKFYKDIGMEK